MHVRELTRRKYKTGKEVSISGPEDVVKILGKMKRFRKEHFVALLLNARHVCLSVETISIGTLNASLVHPREVFQPAVEQSAAAIVLCHNHPSGDPAASEEDIQLTGRLVQAGRIMGIEVLDHVIIARGGHESLKSKQWFD